MGIHFGMQDSAHNVAMEGAKSIRRSLAKEIANTRVMGTHHSLNPTSLERQSRTCLSDFGLVRPICFASLSFGLETLVLFVVLQHSRVVVFRPTDALEDAPGTRLSPAMDLQ